VNTFDLLCKCDDLETPGLRKKTPNQNKSLSTELPTGSVYMTSEKDCAVLPFFTSKSDRFRRPRETILN